MPTVRYAGNEEKAIGGIIGLVILQFRIVWWLIRWTIRIITFGYVWYRVRNPPPLGIPDSSRFEHTMLLAGSGHGKTQTLQHLIASDLPEVAKGNCSVIVIDSQGDMIKNILHLQMLAPNSEFTTLFPQQKCTTKAVPSQKATQKTIFTFLWHVCLVFLAFVFLTILISGFALL